MTVRTCLPVALLAAVLVACAATPTPTPAPQPMTTSSAERDSGVTCRTTVPTGSHLAVRVCETAAERARREAQAREAKEQMSRPRGTNCDPRQNAGC